MKKMKIIDEDDEKIIISDGKMRIKISEIEYVDCCKPYVILHCTDGDEISLRGSLIQFKDKLGNLLIRVGKSCLLNLNNVRKIDKFVVLKSGKKFSVSKAAKAELKKVYQEYLSNMQ